MILSNIIIEQVDQILDDKCSADYHNAPLAQDWARVAKMSEEIGEAISELISYSGQNPRKAIHPQAKERMLAELADAAMTGIYAIQHFTKDTNETEDIIHAAMLKHISRLEKL